MLYEVFYVDDFNRKHLIFVQSLKEVNFIKSRYDKVTFTIINKSFVIKATLWNNGSFYWIKNLKRVGSNPTRVNGIYHSNLFNRVIKVRTNYPFI